MGVVVRVIVGSLVAGTFALGSVGSHPARAAARLQWSRPALVDHRAPFSATFSFDAVSCPAVTLCVAVESGGRVATSGDPSASASAWRVVRVDSAYGGPSGVAELSGVSCPSSSFCVAVDTAGDVLTSDKPAGGASYWQLRRVDAAHALTGVACPSRSLCVAVDNAGDVVSSVRPETASKWRVERVDQAPSAYMGPWLIGVSCASARFCVALDRDGSVVTSSNPAAVRPGWRFVRLDDSASFAIGGFAATGGISCPSASLCVVASGGDLVTSTDPAGGSGTWSVARIEPLPTWFGGVSCPSVSMCVAVDTAGNVFASAQPAGGGTTWIASSVDRAAADYRGLADVSCPSTRLCVAVDQTGNVLSATDPVGGVSAWRLRDLRQGYNAIAGLSCPTTSLCVGYDKAGNIITSTHPAARPSAWRIFHAGASVSSLSCVSASFCFGLDAGGVLTSRDPAGGAQAWTTTPIANVNAISCASATLCAAVAGGGDVMTSTDPTGGLDHWTTTHADTAVGYECGKYGPGQDCDPGLDSISCPSNTFCAASDEAGNVLTSRNPTGGPSAWTTSAIDGPDSSGQITCPSASLCIKLDAGSISVIVSRNPTRGPTAWHTYDIDRSQGLLAWLVDVSCRSASLCVAADSTGYLISSKNPAGSPSAWRATYIGPGNSLSVECSPRGLCIAFDTRGNAFTSADPTEHAPAWTRFHVDSDPLTAASCPSVTLCMTTDGYGNISVGRKP